MSIRQLKKRVCSVIDDIAPELIALGEELRRVPELGFKEFKTSSIFKRELNRIGLSYQDNLAITGVKARLKGDGKPTVAVLGELDAVPSPEHPLADKTTGAAHACGHNVQLATVIGVGRALVESGAINELAGDVILMAVPAEEFVEVEYRMKLKEERQIEFLGGKQELIKIGAFDDVDLAMMIHSQSNTPERKVQVNNTANGFLAKYIKFTGRSAHAGARPHEGVNALNAAALAILAIHAQREAFKDEDSIRVHGIITKGGDAVNVVPSDVRMELFVRGKTKPAIEDASNKVNRAVKSGAIAVGASVEIQNIPGYLPLDQSRDFSDVFRLNALDLLGEGSVAEGGHNAASTDMGDVSHLIPSIHPFIGGFTGSSHAKDFDIKDPEMAYVISTKIMAMTIVDLLANSAEKAKEIKCRFTPKMRKEDYLEYMRKTFVTIVEK
ncbi:MAG: amidohydrolase [Desulfurococcaceae archaeon]